MVTPLQAAGTAATHQGGRVLFWPHGHAQGVMKLAYTGHAAGAYGSGSCTWCASIPSAATSAATASGASRCGDAEEFTRGELREGGGWG